MIASRPGRLILWETALATYWIEGWVVPQSLSGYCGEQITSFAITGSLLYLGRPVPTLTEISRLTTAIPDSRQRAGQGLTT
jgi:hypothetical protein